MNRTRSWAKFVVVVAVGALALACGADSGTNPQAPATNHQDVRASAAKGRSATVPKLPPAGRDLAPASAGSILLLHAEGGGSSDPYAQSVATGIAATGLFTTGQIQQYDGSSGTPSLNFLSDFSCVIAWSDFPYASPAAVGDVLKEYADGGGTVVLGVYALTAEDNPWYIAGGIAGPGYNPLQNPATGSLSPFPRSLDFSTAMTGHPLLDGVSDFTYGGNFNYAAPTLDPGATLVARDNYGVPLIGVNAAGDVVAINLFPPSSFGNSPGVYRTFANACQLQGGVVAPQTCPDAIAFLQSNLEKNAPNLPPFVGQILELALHSLQTGNGAQLGSAILTFGKWLMRFGVIDSTQYANLQNIVQACAEDAQAFLNSQPAMR